MKALIAAGGGILIGVGLAYSEAFRRSEISAKKRYDEQLKIHKRVLNQSRIGVIQNIFEGPHGLEADLLIDPALSEEDLQWESVKTKMSTIFDDAIKVGGEIIVETPVATPDYISAATKYADQSHFVPEMHLSMAYIQAEDYDDEDGRPKEQISIFMGSDEVPMFIQDGQEIDDWAEKIGDSILVDFYKMVPPGAERVLYVRNNSRDEDYEVIQEHV